MERRITAIFAADMVGSTRLMERDEADVLTRHKAHLAELFEPAFDDHRGRIIKGTGDGLIGVFDSVVDAVQCAVEIQSKMTAREADSPEDRRIDYRIGVNLGDVIFDEGDVYGDGVNVAARLEGLAEPGGVVVSGTAYDMLKGQVVVGYRSLGDVSVKNVSAPVRAFQVVEAGEEQAAKGAGGRSSGKVIAGLAVVALFAVFLATSWWFIRPDFTPLDPREITETIPNQPSLVVQAFKNLTGDQEYAWLSEALAENVIAALADVPEVFVIGASTSFGRQGETITETAQRVGAQYVLSGLIQSDGGNLRITSSLSDAFSGRRIWSANWTRDDESLFTLQDEIAQRILHGLNVEVVYGGRADDWSEFAGSPKEYRKLVEGRRSFMRYLPGENENALKLFREVVAAKPESVMAQDWLGWTHLQRVLLGFSEDPATDLKEAFRRADIGQSLGSDRHFGLRSNLAALTKDYENARKFAVAAVQAMPNNSDSIAVAGWALHVAGGSLQGAELMAKAIRMDRLAPDKRWVPAALAEALVSLGKLKEAREVAARALAQYNEEPRWVAVFNERLAVISAAEGNLVKAKQHSQEILTNAPWWNFKVRQAQLSLNAGQDAVKRYLDYLNQAGLAGD